MVDDVDLETSIESSATCGASLTSKDMSVSDVVVIDTFINPSAAKDASITSAGLTSSELPVSDVVNIEALITPSEACDVLTLSASDDVSIVSSGPSVVADITIEVSSFGGTVAWAEAGDCGATNVSLRPSATTGV
jgi:hypothetical protein